MDIDKVRALSDASSRAALATPSRTLGRALPARRRASSRTTAQIPQTRRTIARILTVQRERELGKTA